MKKRCGKILIVLFALFTVFMTTDSAKAEGKLEIPSLRQHIYVYDQENIINDDVEASINKMLEEVEEKTTSEFFVITINSLNNETIESYANDIFNDIGIGKKDENNGLLLLIYKDENPEESKVRIEVGMGLAGLIAKEYDVEIGGVTIEDEKIEELQEDEDFKIPWPVVAVIIVLVILDFIFNDGNITLLVLCSLSSGGSSGGRSGGGGRSAGGGASR